MKRYINIANGITLVRILLLPLLILSYQEGNLLRSSLLISLMIASDIADGWTARASGTAGIVGAILDISADCLFVFTFQIVLIIPGDWPASILILSLLSVGTFLLGSGLRGQIFRGRVGRYSGGALMVLFLLKTAGKLLFLPGIPQFLLICEYLITLHLFLSVMENSIGLWKSLSRSRVGEGA